LQRFLEWPQNRLQPLDFGLAADGTVRPAAALLTWLRHRYMVSNSGWREQLDAFADSVYWAFHGALTAERAALVTRRNLPDVTVTFNRACLLLLPAPILSTGEHCYSPDGGHQFRVSS